MANYVGTARSNYFRVKDEAAFRAFIDRFSGVEIFPDCPREDGRFGLYAPGDEGWSLSYDDEHDANWLDEDHEEPADDFDPCDPYLAIDDFAPMLAEHLAEGEVAVFEEAGHEKARYVSAFALAVSWTGETVHLHLNDIYRLARERFGESANITTATY